MTSAPCLFRIALCMFVPGCLLQCWAPQTQAQGFLSRPVRMIVSFAPGGSADILARTVADFLSSEIKQTVVVENNAGAGGILAMRAVLRQAPLGSSVLFTNNTLVGNLYAFRDPQYKLEDYAVVGTVGLSPFALMVTSRLPSTNIQEFIAYAKANSGKLNYGSSSLTGGPNVLAERLKAAAGLDLVMVPFKGGEPATQALMAGDIHALFAAVGVVRSRIKSPQLRALAVSGERRSEIFPSLPTFGEVGYPTVKLLAWNGLFLPATAPAVAIQRMREAMAKVSASEDMKKLLERMEFDAWPDTLDQFMAYIRAEGLGVRDDFARLKIPMQD